MFPIVARSASGSVASPWPKYSTNFPTTPVSRRICVTVSTRSVAVAPSGSAPVEPEADDLRDEHRDRLAEHRRLGLDPADAPAEDAEAVDHRRVRVGPDERVGERDAVPLVDDAREELEVHLVDDPGARRDDLEVVEGVLPPAQEGVALAVPLELELGVAEDREAVRELVHLHRVVDDELDREERVDLLRVAAEVVHRVPHRGEVDDRRNAGEVLQEDAARRERDLLRRLGARHPAGDGLDVGRRHADSVLHPQHVLEEDPERVRQAPDVVARLQRVDAEDLARLSRDLECRAGSEAVRMGPRLRFKQLGARDVSPA